MTDVVTRTSAQPGVRPDSAVRSPWADRIAEHVSLVEATLTGALDELQLLWRRNTSAERTALEPDLPGQLRQLIRHGGKRTRPVMVFLGWIAALGDPESDLVAGPGHEDMVQAAAAVEMLHCFALVHDDLMDESRTRRGHLTVHEQAAQRHARHGGIGGSARFGSTVAVLVGDLAHSEADRLSGRLPAPMREVWQQMVIELLAGQVADVVGAAAGDRRIERARLVARQKTGFYTVARPLQLGAVAGGADGRALAALEQYGRHAGEAFALRDDILGVCGDPRTTGKPAGDDIRSGKPTVLLALAAQSVVGPAAAALELAGTPAMTDAHVRVVRDAMAGQGVLARVEQMIEDRVADAVAALDPAVLSEASVSELTRVLGDLARRGR